MERFLGHYVLALLGCFYGLWAGRAVFLWVRGIKVMGSNPQKSWAELIEDVAGSLCLYVRSCETVAFAIPFSFHIGPPVLRSELIDAVPVKLLGAVLWMAALIVYAGSLYVFGSSWRIRVGSDEPGKLITHGIFAISRNPIYASFIMMNIATFLVFGHLIFLLVTVVAVPILYRRIRREERFLKETYGQDYIDYSARVGRFCRWF